MGFSGGGTNVLKPHKHSSAVQDGSPLNMNNVTEATLSAGDVVYSDGSALQRLAYPGVPAGETLTAAALSAAPSWSAGSGGLSTLLRNTAVLAVAETTSSTSYVTITNMTLTLAAGTGNCICVFQTTCQGSQNGFVQWDWSTDGASTQMRTDYVYNMLCLTAITATLSGQTADAQFKRGGASGSFTISINNENSVAYWLQIS